MSNVAEIKANFYENLEKLKAVHTREELEEVRGEVYKWRDKLLESSEDFRREIEERQRVNLPGRPIDNQARDIKDRFEGVRRKVDILRSRYMADPRLREMNKIMRKRLTNVQGRMVCPECGEFDMGNIQSMGKGKRKVKVPWCFKCNVQLMPESKIKKWKRSTIKLRKKFTDKELRMGYGK